MYFIVSIKYTTYIQFKTHDLEMNIANLCVYHGLETYFGLESIYLKMSSNITMTK